MMESKKCKMAGAGDDEVQVEVQESDVAIPNQQFVYQADDEQTLRAIFPEETWLIILNKVAPEDQENCSKASPYFCKLLQEHRVLYLFPKVIDIMASIFEQKYNVSKFNAVLEKNADQTPAAVMDAREWKNAVTNCRLVCTFWNKAIENLKGLSVAESLAGDAMLEKFGPQWKNLKKLYYGHLYRKTGQQSEIIRPTVGLRAAQAFAIFEKNWASTLTQVYLEHPFGFDEKTILKESKSLRLNLPRVRKLTLCVFNFRLFLDFILPLKESLEHFVFQYSDDKTLEKRMKREQTIKFAGFAGRMEKSNIWKLFARLETIKLESIGYDESGIVGINFRLFTKEKDKWSYSRKNELDGAI